MAPGRRQEKRVRAGAVAVRDDRHRRRRVPLGEQLVDLGGLQGRAVAGDEQDALGAQLDARATPAAAAGL